MNSRDCYIINIYRSPNSDVHIFFHMLLRLLHDIFTYDLILFLCGDFNINLKAQTTESRSLLNILSEFGLTMVATDYTRITEHSQTLLDNVFSNITLDLRPEVGDTFISDHRFISIKIRSDYLSATNHTYTEMKRMFDLNNKRQFQYFLTAEQWTDVYNETDIDGKFAAFVNILQFHYNNAFPLVRIKHKNLNQSKWITNMIINSSERLQEIFNLQKKFPHFRELYKTAKLQHQALVNDTRINFNSNFILNSANKNLAMWKIIKQVQNNPHYFNNMTVTENDTVLDDPRTVANKFNSFFQQVSSQLTTNTPSVSSPNRIDINPNSLFLSPFTVHEIINIMTKLKAKHTCGYDELSTGILKEFREHLAEILTYLVNISFAEGIFPKVLKKSIIIPIYKKGNSSDMANYRPVALISSLSKVLELCMQDRLTGFLNKYNIITVSQHGFCRGKSTSTALISFNNYILNCIEQRKIPIGIFCDLRKAFDCVQHHKLLEKLENYGIRGKPLQWFATYLKHRKQCVRIKSMNANAHIDYCLSQWLPVLDGVPQGSVLGPLLFNLYINDIAKLLKEAYTTLYADDIAVIIEVDRNLPYGETSVNAICTTLLAWFRDNHLALSIEKTCYLQFHPRQLHVRPLNVMLDGRVLRQCDSIKFLGVNIEATLAWNEHCDNLAKKLHTKVYMLRCLKRQVSQSCLLSVYYSEIQSRLTYGITLWGSSPSAAKVFLAQKAIIRSIVGAHFTESCKPFFLELGILTLPCLYIWEVASYIYKSQSNFAKNESYHDYNTRTKDHLHVSASTLVCTSQRISVLGFKIFNKLPVIIKEVKTYRLFRSTLRSLLQSKTYYSLDEFFKDTL